MAQQSNITVFDGASTPVSHTLVGEGIERLPDGTLKAMWKESLAGVPDYAQIRLSMTKRKLPSGVFRVTSRAEVPVLESISGQNSSGYTAPPKVAYINTFEAVGYFHERSTVTDRRLCRQLGINAVNGFTTSFSPELNSAAAQLFDQLIQVS